MKNLRLFFIFIFIALLFSCDTESASRTAEIDDPVITPFTCDLIGTWRRNDREFTFFQDKTFVYWNATTLEPINIGAYEIYTNETGDYFIINDPVTGMVQSYYYALMTDYPDPGMRALQFKLFINPDLITYWQEVIEE